MNNIVYTIQWLLMEYVGEWEDAPVKTQLSLSEAIKIADFLQGKYPDRKWRVVETITSVVWKSDKD